MIGPGEIPWAYLLFGDALVPAAVGSASGMARRSGPEGWFQERVQMTCRARHKYAQDARNRVFFACGYRDGSDGDSAPGLGGWPSFEDRNLIG